MWECNMLAHYQWRRSVPGPCSTGPWPTHSNFSHRWKTFFHHPLVLWQLLWGDILLHTQCSPCQICLPFKEVLNTQSVGGWKALDKYKAWIHINSNTRHDISTKINCHLTQCWEAESDLPRLRCVTPAHKCVMGCTELSKELDVMLGDLPPHGTRCAS